jgi:SAM-dependent methyltransferase
MLYLDSMESTEAGINLYYKTVYKSDDPPAFLYPRLDALTQYLIENCNPPLLDIGGMDGRLADRIAEMDTSGAGDQITGTYQTVILSHTLEHVYNTHGMLEAIKEHLAPGGRVVVEVPIWSDADNWKVYDYHFEHVQKFTPVKLEELFVRHGFRIELSTPLPRYIEYNCYRLVACLK